MKKGFTLIELLAVIVILAIIALIATPIVLNIISDAKRQSNYRSIENYGEAVENYIADYMMNNSGSMPEWNNVEENIENHYNGNVSCGAHVINSNGTIYLNDCSVNSLLINDFHYGKLSVSITLKQGTAFEPGSKYEIKSGQTVSTWYVISSTNENVKMLSEYNLAASTNYMTQDTTGATNPVAYDSDRTPDDFPAGGECFDYSLGGCYVYEKNTRDALKDSPIKGIVDKYVNSLGIDNLVGSLLSFYRDLPSFGYTPHSEECLMGTCSVAALPDWIYQTNYWTCDRGLAESATSIIVSTDGIANTAGQGVKSPSSGVRPVITIPKSSIN